MPKISLIAVAAFRAASGPEFAPGEVIAEIHTDAAIDIGDVISIAGQRHLSFVEVEGVDGFEEAGQENQDGDNQDGDGQDGDNQDGDGQGNGGVVPLASTSLDSRLVEQLAAHEPPITTVAEAQSYLAANKHFRGVANIGRAGDTQIKAMLESRL